MTKQHVRVLALAGLLLVPALLVTAQGKLPVPVPDGTRVMPLKYGDDEARRR